MGGRRPKPIGHSQAPKSKKRPRRYHHGAGQGRVNERAMQSAVNPAFERAERDEAAARARAARERQERVDHERMLEQLDRVSPAALAPGFGIAA